MTPIIVVITFFQLIVLRQQLPDLLGVLTGALLVVLGLTLFLRGLDLGLFPISESLAHDFARKGSIWWLVFFAFALGFGTTVAEPALIAVAAEAALVAAKDSVIENTDSARAAYALGLRITVGPSVGYAQLAEWWARRTRPARSADDLFMQVRRLSAHRATTLKDRKDKDR